MKKKIGIGDKDFDIMREWWGIYQDFYIPEDTDEYWTKVHNTLVNFTKKYNCEFATDLCVTTYCELERRWKQMVKGAIA